MSVSAKNTRKSAKNSNQQVINLSIGEDNIFANQPTPATKPEAKAKPTPAKKATKKAKPEAKQTSEEQPTGLIVRTVRPPLQRAQDSLNLPNPSLLPTKSETAIQHVTNDVDSVDIEDIDYVEVIEPKPVSNREAITDVREGHFFGEHKGVNISNLATSLNWDVVSSKVFDGSGNTIEGYQALTRSDNGKVLAIRTTNYHHTPNAVLVSALEQLSEITGMQISGFDEWKGGRTLLGYLEMKEPMIVNGYKFDDYITVGNSHDSTSSFFIGTVNRMIRCMNQFSRIQQSFKVRHTKNHQIYIQKLLNEFDAVMQYKSDLISTFAEFTLVEIDQQIKANLIEQVINIEVEDVLGDRKEMNKRRLGTLEALEASIARETRDLGNNLFGLFNGVTHYTTHVKEQKNRVFGSIMGGVYNVNNIALDYCIGVLDEKIPYDEAIHGQKESHLQLK